MSTTLPTDDLLASGYTGTILNPTHSSFEDATKGWGDQNKCHPKLALRPASAQDVSKALLWLTSNNIEFAVRSGGLGDSQSNGVIIDMAKFDKAEYNPSTNTVSLGPGQSWLSAYTKLSSLSPPVTVLGGRVSYVGVGGFTLGGGLSYLSNMYGLAADSLVDAEVVLASGEVVRAKEYEDGELLWGLRGAGGSLGVVTELVLKAYPKPPTVYGGVLLFPLSLLHHLAENLVSVTDPKVSAMLGVARMPPDMQPAVLLVALVFDEEEYAKEVLGWAWDAQPLMDWTKKMTFEESIRVQEMYIHPPSQGTTFQQHNVVLSSLTPSIIQSALDWQSELQSGPEGARFYGASLLFEPFRPGAFSPPTTVSTYREDSRGAWPHTSHTTHIINIILEQPNPSSPSPAQIKENAQHLRDAIHRIEQAAEKEGVRVLPRYPNYFLEGTDAGEYFAGNLGRLRGLKERVDARGVFRGGVKI